MAAIGQTFYTLLDYISHSREEDKSTLFLQVARELYGLDHLAYLGVNVPNSTSGRYSIQCTFADRWVKRYAAQNYVSVDPVVRSGLTAVVPLDWAEIPKKTSAERNFFGESREFGVARQGLVLPVGSTTGEPAIFCINSDMSDKEWCSHKQQFMRDFLVLAACFHKGVLEVAGWKTSPLADALSRRELECLKWAAEGKTAWETSVILAVSERCVRFHLDQARQKLNCQTKVQAVAKAVSLGVMDVS